jgi:periplasmic protein TonB
MTDATVSPDAHVRERRGSPRVAAALLGSTTAHAVVAACLLAIPGAKIDSAVVLDLSADVATEVIEPSISATAPVASAPADAGAGGRAAARSVDLRERGAGAARTAHSTRPPSASSAVARPNPSIASAPPASSETSRSRRTESPIADAPSVGVPDRPVAAAPSSSTRAHRPESPADVRAADTPDPPAAAPVPRPPDPLRPVESAEPTSKPAIAGGTVAPAPKSTAERAPRTEPGAIPREGPASAGSPAPSGDGSGAASERGGAGAGRSLVDAGGGGSAGGGALALAVPGSGGAAAGEYAAYLARFRRRVQEALVYPPLARRRGLTGSVEVEVLIEPGGTVKAAHVITSSSHAVLDAAALDAIRSLPAVPLPEHLPRRALRVRLPLSFLLQ